MINEEEVMESFKTHKFAITAESGVVTGPLGAGFFGGLDIKKKTAPMYSYIRSRGFYAGLELTGQVFLDRFDENERAYYWPGIKAGDILEGRVRIPPVVEPLRKALRDAEEGIAQGGLLEYTDQYPSGIDTTELMVASSSVLEEGEHVRLPPTPQQLSALERAGIKDEMDEELDRRDREEVHQLPPPPKHVSQLPKERANMTPQVPPPDDKLEDQPDNNDHASPPVVHEQALEDAATQAEPMQDVQQHVQQNEEQKEENK